MKLPPLNALRAFEVAARHNGYIDAAAELNVSRGAISRHVKLLEEHLGVALFVRSQRGVDLTEAGRRFQPVIAEAFQRIATEAERLSASVNELRIICPPTISIRWLIPRLEDFRAKHPDIQARVTTDFYRDATFDVVQFDVGISFENNPRRAATVRVQPLFEEMLSPACSPDFASRYRLDTPEDLANLPLLHDKPGRTDWGEWLKKFRVSGVDALAGDVFPSLDMSIKAAAMGQGVVLADLALCRDELDSGALVLPFPDKICDTSNGRYCLIGPEDRWDEPKVRAFRNWAADVALRRPLLRPS